MPELSSFINAKLLRVEYGILTKRKFQKLFLLIRLSQLEIIELFGFDDSGENDGGNCTVNKVSLSPELGNKGVITEPFEVGLKGGNLLLGWWSDWLFG